MSVLRFLALLLVVLVLPGCGALRVFFPSSHHDEVAPALPPDLPHPAILVFSKTNGFRHEEAIPAGIDLLRETAAKEGWSIFFTENGAVHEDALLERFDVVVWHNVSGDVLSETQRAALRGRLEAGAGFVGIHGTGGDPSYAWAWYVEELIGAQFIGHPMNPQFQDARVVIEDRSHPATAALPESWTHNEEWYSFENSTRSRDGFQILLSVDESTYAPVANWWLWETDLAMGEDHPVMWTHCVGRGRVLYSALGHQAETYALDEYRGVLTGAIRWAARLDGDGCDGEAAPPDDKDDENGDS
jgi:type 1 glutamine amidotransferase